MQVVGKQEQPFAGLVDGMHTCNVERLQERDRGDISGR